MESFDDLYGFDIAERGGYISRAGMEDRAEEKGAL